MSSRRVSGGGERGAQPLDLVDLAKPLEDQVLPGPLDHGRELHRLRPKLEPAPRPLEGAIEGLLAAEAPDLGVDDLALAQEEGAAPHLRFHLEHPGAAVHPQDLEQVRQVDLGEGAEELLLVVAVRPRRPPAREDGPDAREELPLMGRLEKELVARPQVLPQVGGRRPLAGQEEEGYVPGARVGAEQLTELEAVEERQLGRGNDQLRGRGQRLVHRQRPVGDHGHLVAGAAQDFLEAAQRRQVAVGDQDLGPRGGHQPILCWSR
jgi:hypothetical protein